MTNYVISDTHIDDEQAIERYMRPFNDVDHMNEVIIQNWNRMVGYDDNIIILGDFIDKSSSRSRTKNIISLLNGDKYLLSDNISISESDCDSLRLPDNYKIEIDGYSFKFVHDIDNVPKYWNNWTIHGKSHNLHIDKYPLYNYKDRNVNVSCELTGYSPVMIRNIVNCIKNI